MATVLLPHPSVSGEPSATAAHRRALIAASGLVGVWALASLLPNAPAALYFTPGSATPSYAQPSLSIPGSLARTQAHTRTVHAHHQGQAPPTGPSSRVVPRQKDGTARQGLRSASTTMFAVSSWGCVLLLAFGAVAGLLAKWLTLGGLVRARSEGCAMMSVTADAGVPLPRCTRQWELGCGDPNSVARWGPGLVGLAGLGAGGQ